MKQTNHLSLRGAFSATKQSPLRSGLLRAIALAMTLLLLAACGTVDLNAPVPVYATGMDPESWSLVPAGEFLAGQEDEPTTIDYNYEIMVTDVTVGQYVAFLNEALADGTLHSDAERVVGFYPGDEFRGAKHELEIGPADYIFVPLDDPASRFAFDGTTFSVKSGWEDHPMTNVSWFGAWGYCGYYGGRLPTELEWEKAARGSEDNRPFPWGEAIARENANFYASRDPFEDMGSFGSRTSPVGFYNGRTYNGYATLDSASPYGLYDMAGDVWQWVGDITPGFSDRFMRGGSKDTYDMDLRIWVRNSATPTYFGPGTGFRCVRIP
jgi:formylglycine-generating enzyme required for sulfatase activity